MKYKIIIFLTFLISSCSEEELKKDLQLLERKNFHEHDFQKNPELKADPGDSVVLHLEHKGNHEGDSGGEGFDKIPYKYDKDVSHTICIKKEEEKIQDKSGKWVTKKEVDNSHYLLIKDKNGKTVETIKAGECKKVEISSGDYTKEIYHGNKEEKSKHKVVFIQPDFPVRHQADHITIQNNKPDTLTLDKSSKQFTAPLKKMVEGTACSLKSKQGSVTSFDNVTLAAGDVAVFSQVPPTSGSVSIFNGSCDDVGIAIKALKLGPLTQVVVFNGKTYTGHIYSKRNDSTNNSATFTIDAPYVTGTSSSVSISKFTENDPSTCKVERSGNFCMCGYDNFGCTDAASDAVGNHTDIYKDSTTLLGVGEVLVFGQITSSVRCAAAHVFKEDCKDFQLINFDDNTYNVILGDANTIAIAYQDKNYGGIWTKIDADWAKGNKDNNNVYIKLPDSSSVNVGVGKASSIQVLTTEKYSAYTTITTNSCTGCDLKGVNFSRKNLSNVNLYNSDLTGAKLQWAQLDNANFSFAKLTCAQANYANFQFANFSHAKLMSQSDCKTDFKHAFLADTDFTSADATGAIFDNADFYDSGSSLTKFAQATLIGTSFINAILKGANFSEATLSKAIFDNSCLVNANMTNLKGGTDGNSAFSLTGAVAYGADFSNTTFDYVNLTNTRFSFTGGTYNLLHISGYNAINNNYDMITDPVLYTKNFPDLAPQTTVNTTCPDSFSGACTGNGGENHATCPIDCKINKSCERNLNCLSKGWDSATQRGRWSCLNGECVKCYNSIGEKDSCNCYNNTCSPDFGECYSSCSSDCKTNFGECQQASHCVSKTTWDSGFGYGHWKCDIGTTGTNKGKGTCVAEKSDTCGDGTCDMSGRWTPVQEPNNLGFNSPDAWTPPSGCSCNQTAH